MQKIAKREFRNVALTSFESKTQISVESGNFLCAKSVEVRINCWVG